MIPRLALLLELAKHHARGPERPKVGQTPARLTYFTAECADGKRVLAYDHSTKRAHSVLAGGRPTHQESSDEQHRK